MNLSLIKPEDPFVKAVRAAVSSLVDTPTQEADRAPVIVTGFSGGPDSTSLLLALWSADRAVHAVHVNHAIRGAESELDEYFCRDLCRELGIGLTVKTLAGVAFDEATLRAERYRCFEEVCAELNSSFCATGHTLDDQIETLLFRLFRGSGLRGLCGMNAKRPTATSLQIIRPMLELRRADVEAFLDRVGITARVDRSNENEAYSRNYIRRVIIPSIEKRFPGAVQRMEKTRLILSEDEKELEKLQAAVVRELDQSGWRTTTLLNLSPALLNRALLVALERHHIEPSLFRVQQVIQVVETNRSATLNEHWDANVIDGLLTWKHRSKAPEQRSLSEVPVCSLRIPGTTILASLNLCAHIRKISTAELDFDTLDGHEIFADLSKINGEMRIRARSPGDRIHPLGMKSSVRLKKFIHTHKSERLLRFAGHTLVVADDTDVVWVPGCGISERIAVRAHDIWRISISSIAPDVGSFC